MVLIPTMPSSILALSLLVVASGVDAETCLSVGSFDWASVEAGEWQGCTPSADDWFVVRAGSTVSVTGHIGQSPTATGAGIQVDPGGVLEVEVREAPLVLSLGDGGLRCEAGSICRLRGRYRAFRASKALPQIEQDTEFFLRAGLLVPCPGRDAAGAVHPDCNGELPVPGDPSRLRFVWPGDELKKQLTRIAPSSSRASGLEEVLCFFDPDPTDAFTPRDVNYCYRIVGVGTDPPSLDIDVRQTSTAERDTDFPLTWRQIVQATVATDAAVGDRIVEIDGATIPAGAAGRFQGYWLYTGPIGPCFGHISCLVDHPIRILDAEDGPAGSPDRLRIGALDGLRKALPAGAPVWIMPGGWQADDPISIRVPVVVRSATEAMEDSRILFRGATELRAVVFDATANVVFEGPGVDPVHASDLWAVDIGSPGPTSHSVAVNDAGNTRLTFEGLTITGGRGRGAVQDRLHGFRIGDGDGVTLILRDLAVRHHGDDCVVLEGNEIDATIERARCQHASRAGQSMSFLDMVAAQSSRLTARDLECVDCTSSGEPALYFPADGDYAIDGLLLWGGTGRLGANGAHITDLQILGADAPGTFSSAALIEGFVLRDVRSSGNVRLFGTDAVLRHAILRNVQFSGRSAFVLSGVVEIDNLAIVDVTVDRGLNSVYSVFRLRERPTVRLGRTVVAWTPSIAHGDGAVDIPNYVFEAQAESLEDVVVDGFLTVGHRPTVGTSAWHMPPERLAELAALAGPCFYDNMSDVPPPLVAQLPPTAIQGVEPPFVNLADGRVDMLPTSEPITHCGAGFGVEAPGIGRYRWFHAISGLAPERMASDGDGDGVIEDPTVAACTAGATMGCSDNCPYDFNPDQADSNGDGVGNACRHRYSCGFGAELLLLATWLQLRSPARSPSTKGY